VARGTQHRKRRPAANARGRAGSAVAAAAQPRRHKPPQWQEQLFFQRLRVHAKAVFLLLALVFAGSFVFLGVGSGSNGISDALQGLFTGKGSGGPSISSLQAKTQKNPLDAKAWRDLATAYETKHDTNGAIAALTSYTGLRPKDTGALSELASEYSTLASQYATDYQNAQQEVAAATPPSAAFAPAASTPLGKVYNDPNGLQDPIANAVQKLATDGETTAYQNYQQAQTNAEKTYQSLVKVTPNDPNAQLELGQAAQAAQDTATATAAYEKFLKLAPHDPLATQVKQQLTLLKSSASGSK
jgi:tetratricopeptide (TPR) repeat protein